MAEWKKSIFVKAIRARVAKMEGTAEEIVDTYSKLSVEEKQEILAEV